MVSTLYLGLLLSSLSFSVFLFINSFLVFLYLHFLDEKYIFTLMERPLLPVRVDMIIIKKGNKHIRKKNMLKRKEEDREKKRQFHTFLFWFIDDVYRAAWVVVRCLAASRWSTAHMAASIDEWLDRDSSFSFARPTTPSIVASVRSVHVSVSISQSLYFCLNGTQSI